MRILKFIVEDQIIKPDPNCDFSGLIPGTEGYLQAEFAFSPEWDGCVKVASFWSTLGREYPCAILLDGKACMIPKEALARQAFKIMVVGAKSDFKITTNKILVKQDGGSI